MTKIKVLSIKEEKSYIGENLLRIVYESNGRKYTGAAKKSDYLDEEGRRSIQGTWMETVRKIEEQDKIAKDPVKKKEVDDKLVALRNEEISGDEYYG